MAGRKGVGGTTEETKKEDDGGMVCARVGFASDSRDKAKNENLCRFFLLSLFFAFSPRRFFCFLFLLLLLWGSVGGAGAERT